MIYFIQMDIVAPLNRFENTIFIKEHLIMISPIKIGFSENPINRIKSIQQYIPFNLNVIGIMKGDINKEKELHVKFNTLRINSTEWFYSDNKLIRFIKKNAQGRIFNGYAFRKSII